MRKRLPVNPFAHTHSNKRYRTLDYSYRELFGQKILKLSLDAGFSCPNRDGTKGRGGCRFCSGGRSGEFAAAPLGSVAKQMEEARALLAPKWPKGGYIAYFQAGSNTYAPVDVLERLAREALAVEGVVGVCFATRADCLTLQVLDFLTKLQKQTYVEVELGLQSAFDATAAAMNRCHSYEDFLTGYKALQARGIPTCVHLIFSLPGESPAMMLESALRVGELRPFAMKLHMLYIQQDAPIARDYLQGGVPLLEREEYIALVCDVIERLPDSIALARLTGDGDRSKLIAPLWIKNKRAVLNGIDRELALRETWQGRLCAGNEVEA